jgi:hypothetical protein
MEATVRVSVVAFGLIALIGVATVSGCSGQQPSPAAASASSAAASPSSAPAASADSTATPESTPGASGAFGGIVHYQQDGAPATTEVAIVPDGATISGTAVTTLREGTHTVRLGCASRNGDTWALGGTTEQTTVPGERAGDWSAVIVKDGPPQQIGIWLSAPPSEGSDCEAFLAATDFATISPENFHTVESGALLPPG